MSPDNDRALCERYPQIFRDRSGDPRVTLMCFGFECGDGWFEIIDTLCAYIQQHMNHHHAKKHMTPEEFDERVQVRAAQVKEKFGGLRFYVDNSDDYVRGLISMAEAFSYRTCETCGNPGKPRKGGWVRTLCDGCCTEKK